MPTWNAKPYPAVFNVHEMLEGSRTALKLADGNANMIIPGHDPIKMQRYSAPTAKLDGIIRKIGLAECPRLKKKA